MFTCCQPTGGASTTTSSRRAGGGCGTGAATAAQPVSPQRSSVGGASPTLVPSLCGSCSSRSSASSASGVGRCTSRPLRSQRRCMLVKRAPSSSARPHAMAVSSGRSHAECGSPPPPKPHMIACVRQSSDDNELSHHALHDSGVGSTTGPCMYTVRPRGALPAQASSQSSNDPPPTQCTSSTVVCVREKGTDDMSAGWLASAAQPRGCDSPAPGASRSRVRAVAGRPTAIAHVLLREPRGGAHTGPCGRSHARGPLCRRRPIQL